MSLVIVIVFVICLCCFFSFLVPPIALYIKAKQNVQKWKCTNVGSDKYVVSRLNGDMNATCMYDPKSVGCYTIKPYSFNDVVDLKQQCDNFINNYPVVTPPETASTTFEEYTCGENSINQKLWKLTGYESPKDMCYKIKNARSVTNEMKSISNTLLKKLKNSLSSYLT